MLTKIAARVRGLFAMNSPENREDEQVVVNNRGDLVVSQSLPALTELVRMGGSWQVPTTTAFAALTTEPTTVAALSLYNAEPAIGMSYAIDSVFLWERVADATQENYTALFGMLNARTSAAPSAGTLLTAATAVKSLSGRSSYGGSAVVRAGATVVNDGWMSLGSSEPFVGAIAGDIWKTKDVPLAGLFLVPPGSAFNLHVTKVAATASQLQVGIRFHEVTLIYKT